MATLESLPHKSILDMSPDEAIEHLRLLRLSRQTPTKKTRSASPTKPKKATQPKLSSSDAAALLKILGGN